MAIHSVLLVEDEAMDRLLLSSWLRGSLPGLRLEEAASLAEARACLRAGPVDAILLDLHLSDHGGLSTLAHVLRAAPEVPIVVLSSEDACDMALEAVKQGAQDYLIKGQVSGPLLWRSLQYASERKKYAQSLRRHNRVLADKHRALHRSEQARKQFVANASHELRNPLAAARASVEALEMASVVPAELQRFLGSALRNLDRLEALIDDMLTLAQVDTGHATAKAESVDVRHLVDEAVASLAAAAERRRMHIAIDAPDPLPRLQLDPGKLSGILDNLLSNALKYSPAATTVRVVLRRLPGPPEQLMLQVVDQGFGVPGGDYASMFEPFVRGVHSNTQIPGTGLGLSIVRQYAQLLGGTLDAEPAPGQGSVFTLKLAWQPAPSATAG